MNSLFPEIVRTENRIAIRGPFRQENLGRLLATIHRATSQLGYLDLILDFSECITSFSGAMVGLCAQVLALRARGIRIELTLPQASTLRRLFMNTGWPHLMDPESFDPSSFRGYSHVPITIFATPTEQESAVNSILSVILGAVPTLKREDFAAIEWSLNEITDNVLVHSQSEIGGLVQVGTFHKATRRVEFVVADAGLGIPATLRAGRAELKFDTYALEQAIREGVTRDKSVGQGNGLFGTLEVCRCSEGTFRICSGHASLSYDSRDGLHIRNESIPFAGTLIVASVNCGKESLLRDALKFGDVVHSPVDHIELRYETEPRGDVRFDLAAESSSMGSRLAGAAVRIKLSNIVGMTAASRVVIDCGGVGLVSSSFADEVFGKLFLELGPLRFMRVFEFASISDTVRSLVDKAISQRVAAGPLGFIGT